MLPPGRAYDGSPELAAKPSAAYQATIEEWAYVVTHRSPRNK